MGEMHAATDADVRADLARALALPSKREVTSGKLAELDQKSSVDSVDIVAALRQACKEAGGQRYFAARMGVTETFVSQIVRGKKSPTAAILFALKLRKVVVVRYVPVRGAAA